MRLVGTAHAVTPSVVPPASPPCVTAMMDRAWTAVIQGTMANTATRNVSIVETMCVTTMDGVHRVVMGGLERDVMRFVILFIRKFELLHF